MECSRLKIPEFEVILLVVRLSDVVVLKMLFVDNNVENIPDDDVKLVEIKFVDARLLKIPEFAKAV